MCDELAVGSAPVGCAPRVVTGLSARAPTSYRRIAEIADPQEVETAEVKGAAERCLRRLEKKADGSVLP